MPAITADALDEIVRLEPRTSVFGQQVSPWTFWRPADDRLTELEHQLVPLLPGVRQVMERAAKAWKPESPAAQRPAAYLLARWGTGALRERGHEVLEDLAQADQPFYYALESIRLLHALKTTETASLIRSTAARASKTKDLPGSYVLMMATALHQLGDPGYAAFVDVALHDARAGVRMDTARFLASTRRKRTARTRGGEAARRNSCCSSVTAGAFPHDSTHSRATTRRPGCSPAATFASTPSCRSPVTHRPRHRSGLPRRRRGRRGGTRAARPFACAAGRRSWICRRSRSSRRSGSERSPFDSWGAFGLL